MLAACAGTDAAVAPARAFQRPEAGAPAAAPVAPPAPAPQAIPAAEPAASGVNHDRQPVASAPPAPATADDPEAGAAAADVAAEAALRRSLAQAEDPTEAALELLARLTAGERFEEALAVLDTALARQRTSVLRVARAGVLRDLGRRHLAVAELRSLRREEGQAALHPSLLCELAELEWLEGDAAGAVATLRQLADVHGNDAWTIAHRDEWQALAAAAQNGGVPSRMRARDLLGNLRGAPRATERVAVLEQLCATTGQPDDEHTALREHAIAIALGDESAPVRARAVQLAVPGPEWTVEFCRTALADESPLVRQAAAKRTEALLGQGAGSLLLECLEKEADPSAFLAVHAALAQALRTTDDLSPTQAATPSERADAVARWRTRVPR